MTPLALGFVAWVTLEFSPTKTRSGFVLCKTAEAESQNTLSSQADSFVTIRPAVTACKDSDASIFFRLPREYLIRVR